MQPYFLPYIGYFQLIQAVDLFIVYDDVKYTKKGWINRNRLLRNGADAMFSVPLKSDSDFLPIKDRVVSPDFNKGKLLSQFRGAYQQAPYFRETQALLDHAILENETNLFRFIFHSLETVCGYLGIASKLSISSKFPNDHSLRGKEKVAALCRCVEADVYINAIGGQELYSKEDFALQGIGLYFLKSRPFEYEQFGVPFVPWLSIVDVLMFNSKERIREQFLPNYDLI